MSESSTFRCGAAARWLPRSLAGALLVAGLLGAYRIDPGAEATGWGYARPLVIVFGSIVALAVLRKGGEVRMVITLTADALVFRLGARERQLPYRDIASIAYAPPFSASRSWLPAVVLGDRFGVGYRLSALLDGGDLLLDELLARCRRSDLDSWVSASRLRRRMGRARRIALFGYLAAALIVTSALWLYLGSRG